ncbi:MAG: transcription elongation factor GreA [Eubacteriales bacterium]|nr:transcription elongation factor GreA [Eubacteriales bacterium]MDD3074032.1 transcription elongation factor GreA [Eubacteriales bacterium]MDD4079501.1 transcription elongation factor GreA [Eubacteriales bacterium]MDD4768695.1 transcription elongation factor GreA [Eubacteriales bacterium]
MNSKEVILTPDGYRRLEEELELLRTVRRKEIAERIKEALAFGDISENSEYDDAKQEQAFVEGRVFYLEKTLRNARVLEDDEITAEKVGIGSIVLLRDLEYNEELEYTIVSSAEANPNDNKISNESPVGRAISGQQVGSIVEVTVPAGTLKYEILGIRI